MGDRTKIDWCDASWNPITGCYHDCEYCYARGIATRFDGKADRGPYPQEADKPPVFDIDGLPVRRDGRILAYPFGFAPTFHRYRLEDVKKWSKPRTIFVGSMADIFGSWVPFPWIRAVMEACRAAPQHRYLFLTKNPARYASLNRAGCPFPERFMIGTTVTRNSEATGTDSRLLPLSEAWDIPGVGWFASVEPMLERFGESAVSGLGCMDWVIVGAETGNRAGRVTPEKAWVMDIAEHCAKVNVPVFMKESLRKIMGPDFKQEFPWEVSADA